MVADDDAELVRRTLAGETRWFGELVARYERVVFNLALRMVRDREDARDVAQTAFVKAYEKLHTWDSNHRFFSWLYRITINEALNQRAKQRPSDPLDESLPAPGPGPEARVVQAEVSGAIQEGLMELTSDYREVLVLRYVLDLSHREMSELLHVPEKTVKSRLHTARERLGTALRRRGHA